MIKKTKEGRNSFGEATSIVAMIAEIEISKKGRLTINKINCRSYCPGRGWYNDGNINVT